MFEKKSMCLKSVLLDLDKCLSQNLSDLMFNILTNFYFEGNLETFIKENM